MKKSLKITIGAAILCGIAALSVWAYSIAAITTAVSFTTVTASVNPPGNSATITSTVCPGDVIPFSVGYSVTGPVGGTVLPKTIGFGSTTTVKPVGASDVATNGGFTTSHTFTSASSTFTDSGSMTAPATLGAYTVRVGSVSGTGGPGGISGGQINVNFTVADCAPPCTLLNTVLTVSDLCVTLHQSATVDLTATLVDENAVPLSGQTIHFSVPDASFTGDAVTDSNGVATISGFNVSGLGVGDHAVNATFDGVPCPNDPNGYNGTNGSGNLGVTFIFIGFEQPINADGSSVFKGGTVPVKIRIADANGAPVTDAEAFVFFAMKTGAVVGDTQEAISQSAASVGNQMRYDPIGDHYVFQWDITGAAIANGTYLLWVDLGEGQCGDMHQVCLSIAKAGKGLKK
jgi:hypothetical protein